MTAVAAPCAPSPPLTPAPPGAHRMPDVFRPARHTPPRRVRPLSAADRQPESPDLHRRDRRPVPYDPKGDLWKRVLQEGVDVTASGHLIDRPHSAVVPSVSAPRLASAGHGGEARTPCPPPPRASPLEAAPRRGRSPPSDGVRTRVMQEPEPRHSDESARPDSIGHHVLAAEVRRLEGELARSAKYQAKLESVIGQLTRALQIRLPPESKPTSSEC